MRYLLPLLLVLACDDPEPLPATPVDAFVQLPDAAAPDQGPVADAALIVDAAADAAEPDPDGAVDGAVDAASDAADVALDAAPDASLDAEVDAVVDALIDAEPDALVCPEDATVYPPDPDGGEPPVVPPQSGDWDVTVAALELGGVFVRLRLTLVVDGETITRAGVRPKIGDLVGDELVFVEDVPVTAEGFSLEFPRFDLPADFSPTGGRVDIQVNLNADEFKEDAFCGSVTGRVETFMADLRASTFGAAPAGLCTVPPACPGVQAAPLPRIMDPEMCPDLQAGRNLGFESGGVERNFHLMVPADHQPGEMLPIVFLHHGIAGLEPPWGNVDSVIERSGIAPLVDSERFVLVVPAGRPELIAQWTQSPLGDDPDLAFFDDMLTCIGAQFGFDPARIHVLGHSAGGLFAVYLALRRFQVVASGAATSGAITIPYPDPAVRVPFLVAWGGEEDMSFGQNFHLGALQLMFTLQGNGHFVLACNHGLGPLREDLEDANRHTWPGGGTPWMLQFLFDHPQGVDPEPYAEGPPEGLFPPYCAIPEMPPPEE